MSLDFATLSPYDRVTFRGRSFNARDAAMILETERRFGATVYITQGSFNDSVDASAGTHDKGGAVDWSLAGMTRKRKAKFDRAAKNTGWCYWRREYLPGTWPEHGHAVARGCLNLADLAAWQVGAFDRRETGLVGNAYDGSYRPDPKVEFDYRQFKDEWAARTRMRRITDRIGEWRRTIRGLRNKIAGAKQARTKIARELH